MPSRFVQSVQSYLEDCGFKPGPLDGIIGSKTVAAWNAFLDKEEAKLAAPTHKVIGDPGAPFSITCVATCFGYKDAGDNGIGAWGLDTNNTTTVAASVPIPILEATCGGLTKAHVSKFKVCVIANGKTVTGVEIGDEGPGESVEGKRGLIEGKDGVLHALDLTYGLCSALGLHYDANTASFTVTWWLEDCAGNPVEMLGLDAPKKIIG